MKNNNYIREKLNEIDNHFKNITIEEFQENLVKAGYGEISSLEESHMELISEELTGNVEEGVLYRKQNKNYKFNDQSVSYFNNNTYNKYSEVA